MSEEKKKDLQDKNKRPPNAYFLYCNSIRASLKSQFPELANKELIKKMSDMWKALPDSEKKSFVDQADNLKAEYRNSHPPNAKKAVKPKKISPPKENVKRKPNLK